MCPRSRKPVIGIIGFGAFGRLIARHLAPRFPLAAFDPAWSGNDAPDGVQAVALEEAAAADVVILAVPVAQLGRVAAAISPHLRAGALVLDVGSVKVGPVATLVRELPFGVDILATHPLFGPQSTRDGLDGHTIVLCPVRGRRTMGVARILRHVFGLKVVITTPEAHDRELAAVQGLTHLVGRLVAAMEPLPTGLTTRSFERLIEAVAMVADDAPAVFDAILRDNPYAATVRERFFCAAAKLEAELTDRSPSPLSPLTARSPRSAMVSAWSSAPESAP